MRVFASAAAHGKRMVYLVHRWTGIGMCVLMALWLVSGVVMMFVGYPRLLPLERLAPMPALAADGGCCVEVDAALAAVRAAGAVPDIQAIALTSIAARPRYVLQAAGRAAAVVDAATGLPVPRPGPAQALEAAEAFAGVAGRVAGRAVDDVWTHARGLDPHRPLFRVEMQDATATWLYVSSVTGEVVMDVSRRERVWNYAGAWLHWLYLFRDGSRDPVWSWTVIGLSAVGTVSALAGACAGIWRWRFRGRYKSGAKTPYRALPMRWHHLAGLLFGAVLIAWIFSGLMSMNPLGLLDRKGERLDLAAYRSGTPGADRPGIATGRALRLLREAGLAAVELEWRVLDGRPYLLARDADGGTRLVVPQAHGHAVVPRWPDEALRAAAAKLIPAPIGEARVLREYDDYYYARSDASMYAHGARSLPVLRIRFDDPGRTQAYLDPATGDLALSLDRSQRAGRWLFNLLHSWDLPPMLRAGWIRIGALILLSLGAMAIALTGCIIGYARVRMRFRKATGR